MHLFSFALQLQQFCLELGLPRRLHRNTGAGAIGAKQEPDSEHPQLFHVFITFSLEIPDQLAEGIIIKGIGWRPNSLDAAEDDDAMELSDEEDDELWDDSSCEDPDDAPFEDPGDSVTSPAAGSSTSPSALYATPASSGKRPISHAQEEPVKRRCVQAGLLSFFTKPPK